MNVNDMYRICQYAINKAQNGYLTSSEFNLLVNQAQISHLDYLLGEFQQYQYGRAQARVSYSQNENVRQRLTPLIFKENLTVPPDGICAYPNNYMQVDAMWTSDGLHRIRFVPQDSLYSYYNSQIDPVEDHPIYMLLYEGFQFYPLNIGTAKLSYVTTAPQILWAYTLDGNNRPVYDPVASEQPVWYETDLLEIIARVLKLVGVNLQIGQVEQYANQVTQIGQ